MTNWRMKIGQIGLRLRITISAGTSVLSFFRSHSFSVINSSLQQLPRFLSREKVIRWPEASCVSFISLSSFSLIFDVYIYLSQFFLSVLRQGRRYVSSIQRIGRTLFDLLQLPYKISYKIIRSKSSPLRLISHSRESNTRFTSDLKIKILYFVTAIFIAVEKKESKIKGKHLFGYFCTSFNDLGIDFSCERIFCAIFAKLAIIEGN